MSWRASLILIKIISGVQCSCVFQANKYRRLPYVSHQLPRCCHSLRPLTPLRTEYHPTRCAPESPLPLTKIDWRPTIITPHNGLLQDGRSVRKQHDYSHGHLRPWLPLREYMRWRGNTTYKIKWRHNPEDHKPHFHRSKNLRSLTFEKFRRWRLSCVKFNAKLSGTYSTQGNMRYAYTLSETSRNETTWGS
jgi:hypothetical protein